MNRDALFPVVVVVLGTLFVTSTVSVTLEESAGVGAPIVDGIDNGGLAVVLVAIFLLFESTDYAGYRSLGGRRLLTDGVLVFVLAAGVTALATAGLGALGLDTAGVTAGPLSVDGIDVGVSIVAFLSGLFVFFDRNRRFLEPAGSSDAVGTTGQ